MYVKSVCEITLDNPHADGRITTWGVARDWVAEEPKISHPTSTPDVAGAYGWDYGGDSEYIAPLKAIGPAAIDALPAMSFA